MSVEAKAAHRRASDPAFGEIYLIGHGLDLAPLETPLGQLAASFPGITGIDTAAWGPQEIQTLDGIPDERYDFVHSCQGLALVENCFAAIGQWFRVLKPGGHLILTVPDEDMAAQGSFPPAWAPHWRWSFAAYKRRSWNPQSINLFNLVMTLGEAAEIKRIAQVDVGYHPDLGVMDQTGLDRVEAQIEAVIRKRRASEIDAGGRLPP